MSQPIYTATIVGLDADAIITSTRYDAGTVSVDIGDLRLITDDPDTFERIAAECITAVNLLRGAE